MIAVVNSSVANVASVVCALRRLEEEAVLSSGPDLLEGADGVILPGVGAFSAGMENLSRKGLPEVLTVLAGRGTPMLGICLGLQLFFTESEEHGLHKGLDLFAGQVRRFPPGVKVPHMGWNEVLQQKDCPLFDGIADGSFFYFAHSYFVQPRDPDVTAGTTNHGAGFVSAVSGQNLYGVQFHPEKSGPVGERLLHNFCRLCR